MAASFFFYDLETTGVRPREGRIMQFAGQRTDMDLQPIGEPFNILIKLTPDVLPDPDAVLLTGITPQQTIADGITEAEFLHIFETEVATPGTIFTGYNSVRFDDEFMRFTRWRNFYDPYDWQWKDERSRWDLLDVVRAARALRPDGIDWPFAPDGKPTVRLEFMTKANKLLHENAHDALGDVNATIAVARLIKDKQPDLFNYLLKIRSKKAVEQLVGSSQPFVYTSGKYSGEFEKTTVVVKLADDAGQGALVYDLRVDPAEFTALSSAELAKLWQWNPDKDAKRLPVKTLKYNRCPAVAPLGVLDAASQKRLRLDKKIWEANLKTLQAARDFPAKLREAQQLLEKQRQAQLIASEQDVDGQLYDGFLPDSDCRLLPALQQAAPDELMSVGAGLHDERLQVLLPLYKARNFPQALDADEQTAWDSFRRHRLFDGGGNSRLAKYFARLGQCAELPQYKNRQFLLEELQLYGQSLMPSDGGE